MDTIDTIIVLLFVLWGLAWLLSLKPVLRRFMKIVSWSRWWLKGYFDPINDESQRQGGNYYSDQYWPLLWMHFLMLHPYTVLFGKEINKKRSRFSKKVRLVLNVVDQETIDAGVVSPAKGSFLIYLTSALFTTLYDTLARVVSDPLFCPEIGHNEPLLTAESQDTLRAAVKNVCTTYPEFQDKPGRAIFLVSLVHFALEFAVLHEIEHVKQNHIAVSRLVGGRFGMAENRSSALGSGIAPLLLQRFEMDADREAAEQGLAWSEYYKQISHGQKLSAPQIVRIAFGEHDQVLECWLIAICILFVLLGKDQPSPDGKEITDHPFPAFRFELIFRRSRELGLVCRKYQQSDSWKEMLKDVSAILSAAGVPVTEFLDGVERYASDGIGARIENTLDTQIATQMRVEADIIGLDRVYRQQRPQRPESKPFVEAFDRLCHYVEMIPGSPREVLASRDFASMKQTLDYQFLASSIVMEKLIQNTDSFKRLLLNPFDRKSVLILYEIARDRGVKLPSLEWDS